MRRDIVQGGSPWSLVDAGGGDRVDCRLSGGRRSVGAGVLADAGRAHTAGTWLAAVVGLSALACPGVGATPPARHDRSGGFAMSLSIRSSAFAPGAAIPPRYTCDGVDHSPALVWSGVPEGTRSLALIDRKSTRLNSSHIPLTRMPSSA